jgi:hypothetical protein
MLTRLGIAGLVCFPLLMSAPDLAAIAQTQGTSDPVVTSTTKPPHRASGRGLRRCPTPRPTGAPECIITSDPEQREATKPYYPPQTPPPTSTQGTGDA